MLQIFNTVVHKNFDKEAPVNKKLTLAVAATAVAGLMALVGAPLLSQSRAASQSTIQGVWRITEVTTTRPNASTNNSPQPGLYIFTAKHYSIVRVNGTTARPYLPADQTTKATAAQLLAVYGPYCLHSPIRHIRTGRWKLTTRPLVSKNTAPMALGVFNTSSYKLDGKTLTITPELNQNGPIANPQLTVKL